MTEPGHNIAALGRARWDPIVVATRWGMVLVDHLLFGAPSNAAWNWLCARQALRYRELLSE